MSDWISAEDRLPEKGEIVDVWLDNERNTGWYLDSYSPEDGSLYWYSGRGNLFEIESVPLISTDYWMNIPEPPNDNN